MSSPHSHHQQGLASRSCYAMTWCHNTGWSWRLKLVGSAPRGPHVLAWQVEHHGVHHVPGQHRQSGNLQTVSCVIALYIVLPRSSASIAVAPRQLWPCMEENDALILQQSPSAPIDSCMEHMCASNCRCSITRVRVLLPYQRYYFVCFSGIRPKYQAGAFRILTCSSDQGIEMEMYIIFRHEWGKFAVALILYC